MIKSKFTAAIAMLIHGSKFFLKNLIAHQAMKNMIIAPNVWLQNVVAVNNHIIDSAHGCKIKMVPEWIWKTNGCSHPNN